MVLILCNAPPEQGASIASVLVEERLAACVSQTSTVSTYRWDGKIHEDEEVTLTIKTAEETLKACSRRLKELHPYDVPEILVVPIDVSRSSPAYVEWVRSECSSATECSS